MPVSPVTFAAALSCSAVVFAAQAPAYPWPQARDETQTLASRFAPPEGYQRTREPRGSFGEWLRRLPLKKGCPDVLLFNGQKKGNQAAHAAVVDIDVGDRDLQQCADAVMRLRAEFLRSAGQAAAVSFHFTSGDRCDLARWLEGWRPVVRGQAVRWTRSAAPDASYATFRRYLDTLFTYAGTQSLSKELRPVASPADMQVGDVFIQGGSPGHAVLVADMAVHAQTGKRLFLLVQSYMPAQEVHVLRNPSDATLSPWYRGDFGGALVTPEWTFRASDLRRF